MRSIPTGFVALIALLAWPAAVLAQAVPMSRPAPLTYAELVDRAAAAGENLAAVEKETRDVLKSLTAVAGPEADEQRKAALVKRRTADRQAWLADRRIKLYWLGQQLPEAQRAELDGLSAEEEDLLLEARTVAQRLFVPLPPKSFQKTPVEEVLTWIETRSDVRVIADWPALAKVGVSKSDVVTLDLGKYDKPALQTIQTVMSALAKDFALVDPRHTDAVLITTREGQSQLQERDRLLTPRVRDARAWMAMPLQVPAAFTQIPLIEVLERLLGSTTGEVHWDRLEPLGLTPDTRVSMTLGVHRTGHGLALLCDVLNGIGKQPNAVAFDLSPEGVVILSDKRGLGEALAAADWLTAAVAKHPDLQEQLRRRIGDLRGQNVPLADAVAYLRQTSGIDLRADWPSLAASGLTERSTVSLDLPDPTAAQAFRLVFATPAGKPPVNWTVDGTTLVVKSAR